MDIILYSNAGNDEDISSVAGSMFVPRGAMVFAFTEGLDAKAIENALPTDQEGTKARAVCYPHSHLVDWPFGIMMWARDEFREGVDKLFVDASFLRRHPLPLGGFLNRSRESDFYAASARFDEEEDGFLFAFPTWEVARISVTLWNDTEFRRFVNGQPATTNKNDKLHAARVFYDAFSTRFDLKCLLSDYDAKSFDPVGTKELNLQRLMMATA